MDGEPSGPGSTSLEFLAGVGPARAKLLERMGLRTLADLVTLFPRRYEDRRRPIPVAGLREGDTVVVSGILERIRGRRLGPGRHLLSARLRDATGEVELVWFNRPYLADWLRPGVPIHAFGRVKRRGRGLQIPAPEFEIDTGADDDDDADDGEGGPSLHMGRIVPIYRSTRGVHQRWLRRAVWNALERLPSEEGPFDHFHPGEQPLDVALRRMHFPSELEEAETARRRLAFDEHFRFATRLWQRRASFRGVATAHAFRVTEELDSKIRSIFPFRLTEGQNRVIEEVVADLRGPAPMYRLLQGDVGTGKTAIALYALLVGIRHGMQGVLMAPTEVLAEQHGRTIRRYLRDHPVRVDLLTGSVGAGERRRVLADMASGRTHIVCGTHALLEDSVRFARLGVVVIDEQHRFGVRQRQLIQRKGERPHLLVMTATPIPRSLCLTCYGDLDLSLLGERPEGRAPVRTRIVPPGKRGAALDFVRRQLATGRQAFFIYPLIEESEALGLPAAEDGFRQLREEVFPEFAVGLVHGRLPAREKEERLARFRGGELRVLVSTVVVEVGIDVPGATVLWIEDASRFGLAQLHQLRGRVGRGAHQGFCLVAAAGGGADARRRLEAFASTTDGFRLAELDLELRGPGDFLGVRQAGRPEPGSFHPLRDLEGFRRVRGLVDRFWSEGPEGRPLPAWAERLRASARAADDPIAGF